MRTRLVVIVATSAAVGALLVGCAPGGVADPLVSPTPEVSVSSSPTPSPSATAAAPPAASCENLLDPAHLTAYLDAGATLTPTPEFRDHIRTDPYFSSLQIFVDHVVCPVILPMSNHVLELYGYAPTTPEGEATAIAQLTAEGWTEIASDGGRLFLHPPGGEDQDIFFRIFFRNGFAWVAYSDVQLAEIIANSPAI